MTVEQGLLDTTSEGGALVLAAAGSWTLTTAAALTRTLAAIQAPPGDHGKDRGPSEERVRLDLGRLVALDTVGALLLRQFRDRLLREGHPVLIVNVRPEHIALIDAVWHAAEVEPLPSEPGPSLRDAVETVGRTSLRAVRAAVEMISFFGLVCTALFRVLVRPGRLRLTALVYHMDHTGLRCLPILGLLSFLIGVVLAYKGAEQLRRLGAEIYVVNLLGLSILREIGILITAIIVAGRSGSAFTAQIGTMRVNEEIDAMQTMGLNTVDTLVLPRIIGLVIALPMLTFFADIMGLIGGAFMCYFQLGITIPVFMRQLGEAISVNTLMVGLIKAPVFAFVIALVGCYEGFQVERNAASVGLLTTRSVVEGIFLVIVLDAAFSIMFSVLGI